MLSVVICAHNEENNLPRAVSSIKAFAEEIVVVDSQSTDNTAKIAKKLGCTVFHHKYTGIVEPVRNYAISKARGDWILLLDADEEISAGLAEEIIRITKNHHADYYRISRQNIIFGKWIQSDHWWPDYSYRLFKKNALVWSDQIHSQPVTSGKGLDLSPQPEKSIIHHNYQTISQYLSKLDTYTDFQSREILVKGFNFHWSNLLEKPASEFINQFFARKGYRDGIHGLALSLLQSFSELVVYLKIWQQQNFLPQEIKISQFETILVKINRGFVWWLYEVRINSSSWLNKIRLKLLRKIDL